MDGHAGNFESCHCTKEQILLKDMSDVVSYYHPLKKEGKELIEVPQ